LEVARDYLLDYFTARGMGLWLLTFRERRLVMETAPTVPWPDGELKVTARYRGSLNFRLPLHFVYWPHD